MHGFGYARAANEADLTSALCERDTMAIAGGTELLNWMRLGIARPKNLIDLAPLGLDHIERRDGELTIGARATLNEVGENALVVAHAPVLAQACLAAASAQVRNRATLGGNVLQKTRCAYFRAEAPLPWGCNKRIPGSGCAAKNGVNDRMAIFGWTDDCVATQPSDPAVALACLDAEAELVGPDGTRRIAMTQFHLTQEDAAALQLDPAHAETRLRRGEIITGYRIALAPGERSAYLKVRERASYEYALVSAAAAVRVRDGRIERARVALGSVAQRPWRLEAAEARLAGVAAVREDARPLSGNGYKVALAANTATRVLLAAAEAT